MHYAVPRILDRHDLLERLYTDISVDHGLSRLFKFLPNSLRTPTVHKLCGRSASGIPRDRTVAFELLGYKYAAKLRRSHSESDRLQVFMWMEKEFSKNILRFGFPQHSALYTFNGASLGLLEHARHAGISTVLEQTIAPKRIELELLGEETRRLRGSTAADPAIFHDFIQQEEAEWQMADRIICASDFVRDGLIKCGVDANKCIVVPYGVDLSIFRRSELSCRAPSADQNIRVLFIGAVNRRKGIETLLECMRLLRGTNITCRIVGPLSADALGLLAACPSNTVVVGSLPRSAIPGELEGSDIFCLPSLCEGSATVVYEALASGLPVVTTPNAGSIVRDGVDGLMVTPSDAHSLAEAITKIAEDLDYRQELARNAISRSEFGSLDAYSRRLISALSGISE